MWVWTQLADTHHLPDQSNNQEAVMEASRQALLEEDGTDGKYS